MFERRKIKKRIADLRTQIQEIKDDKKKHSKTYSVKKRIYLDMDINEKEKMIKGLEGLL